MDYKEYNDYELVHYAVGEQSEEAMEILYQKYKPLIVNFAKKMLPGCSGSGVELNDLIQEGMLGLNNAIDHYIEQKDITFYTFARTCIERRIISATIAAKRQKHKILNESLSLEMTTPNEETMELEYLLKDESMEPSQLLLTNEREEKLFELFKERFTEFELQVFELKMNQFSYDEIATILEKNKKAIDNALQRIKNKIKEILKELD